MKPLSLQLSAVLLLFVGESVAIYAQMAAARAHDQSESQGGILPQALLAAAIAGAVMIAGYVVGYKAFKNIWVVSALSVTAILVVEPLVAFTIFQTLPGRGALAGMILGALGFLATFLL